MGFSSVKKLSKKLRQASFNGGSNNNDNNEDNDVNSVSNESNSSRRSSFSTASSILFPSRKKSKLLKFLSKKALSSPSKKSRDKTAQQQQSPRAQTRRATISTASPLIEERNNVDEKSKKDDKKSTGKWDREAIQIAMHRASSMTKLEDKHIESCQQRSSSSPPPATTTTTTTNTGTLNNDKSLSKKLLQSNSVGSPQRNRHLYKKHYKLSSSKLNEGELLIPEEISIESPSKTTVSSTPTTATTITTTDSSNVQSYQSSNDEVRSNTSTTSTATSLSERAHRAEKEADEYLQRLKESDKLIQSLYQDKVEAQIKLQDLLKQQEQGRQVGSESDTKRTLTAPLTPTKSQPYSSTTFDSKARSLPSTPNSTSSTPLRYSASKLLSIVSPDLGPRNPTNPSAPHSTIVREHTTSTSSATVTMSDSASMFSDEVPVVRPPQPSQKAIVLDADGDKTNEDKESTLNPWNNINNTKLFLFMASVYVFCGGNVYFVAILFVAQWVAQKSCYVL